MEIPVLSFNNLFVTGKYIKDRVIKAMPKTGSFPLNKFSSPIMNISNPTTRLTKLKKDFVLTLIFYFTKYKKNLFVFTKRFWLIL